jgi:hypothetical protein
MPEFRITSAWPSLGCFQYSEIVKRPALTTATKVMLPALSKIKEIGLKGWLLFLCEPHAPARLRAIQL